jgi:threonine dehydrogenase-like Zn-dependent dehydrogenase
VGGDGAVGLCAVLAARRLGAERIIALSRHDGRQQIAHEFGGIERDVCFADAGPEVQGDIDTVYHAK